MSKKKHKLTLEFDNKADIKQWKAWYIDGGGEQYSDYFWDHKKSTKSKLKLYSPYARCPKCSSMNLLDFTDMSRHERTVERMKGLQLGTLVDYKKTVRCEDCRYNFDTEKEVKNEY